jgi:Cu+-exporting ATPase
MNGVLAWSEGMGMPMRPAMSVMEETAMPPVTSRDAGLAVTVRGAGDLRAGRPTTLTIEVRDAGTGELVTDLVRTHQVWMHAIITRADLGTFAHLHPEPTGRPGVFTLDVSLPTGGEYALHTEFRRQGEMADVLDDQPLTVSGTAPTPVAVPATDVREATDHGVTVRLTGDAVVGDESDFTIEVEGVDDLRPYLGAAGHVVVMRSDGELFQHAHAETYDGNGRPVDALPGTTFGPDLDLHVRFVVPGTYRLWAQVALADGTVVTAPFVVHAR